jgi:hypothetical protein
MKLIVPYLSLIAFAILLVQCTSEKKQFEELDPADTRVDFRNDIVETQHNNILTYEYTYNGAGVAAGDVNNDGLADIYFSGNSVSNKLYLNKGEWKFEDVTVESKTEGRKDWKTGVTMADVNGDGWLDIYVCYSGNVEGEGYNLPVIKDRTARSNQLFINNKCEPGGVPTFTERAVEYGLDAIGTFSTQGYFFDYDLDGDLDMFLVNHANMFYAAFFNTKRLRNLRHPYFGNKLYRNESSGSKIAFKEVSGEAGIHGSGLNFGLSASISDINLDGWPDIYVTNDYEEQDFCYINNRNGTFREVSHKVFAHLSKFGMGSDIADINNDGYQDVLVLDMLPEDNHRQKLLKGPDEYERYTLAADSGYHHQYMRNTLQLNRGFADDSLPRFSEIGQLAGISNTDWSWTPFIVDIDNDGLKDIFISNGYPRDFTNLDFMKYTSTVYQEAKVANKPVDYLNIIQQLPETRVTNYVFKNKGGIEFSNVTKEWGMTKQSVSNGAAYADFDNDGDFDLVMNNLNDVATIYRNNTSGNNFVKVKLVGPTPNSVGVGSRITLKTDSSLLTQEAYFTRGYESSVEPVIVFGIGKSSVIKELIVRWPNGNQSTFNDVKINETFIADFKDSKPSERHRESPVATILSEITPNTGLNFKHRENKFVDFKFQRLLYYQLSKLGGQHSVADVNNDGNDDIYFDAPSGQSGKLFLGKNDGTFIQGQNDAWSVDSAFEDTSSTFFDADGDGDNDLYVVSGGGEFLPGAPLYQDRLYINDGKGIFTKTTTALPAETSSGGEVAAADYDKDGDIDLFVGGRHSPANYGIVPGSFILANETKNGTIKFANGTSAVNPSISNIGMITSACWTDFNNDTWPDLIIAGEWMPVRIFANEKGKLVEITSETLLSGSTGWWSCIYPADVDVDGDMDYLLGNAGSNLQFKPSSKEPAELYAYDFNSDGVIDPIMSYYINGVSSPLPSRDELLDQMSSLRKKFIKYADYADANVEAIVGKEMKDKAYHFSAVTLQSAWLENVDGKQFNLHALPAFAQVSCVNAFLFEDFDGDGTRELLVAGNLYSYKPQFGRSDASTGLLLDFRDGKWTAKSGVRANMWMTGDIRDVEIMKFSDGKRRVVVSRNNDAASVFSFGEKQSK